jgi:hypothetical protein
LDGGMGTPLPRRNRFSFSSSSTRSPARHRTSPPRSPRRHPPTWSTLLLRVRWSVDACVLEVARRGAAARAVATHTEATIDAITPPRSSPARLVSGHSAYVYIKMRKPRRGGASRLTSQNFIQSTAPLVTAPRLAHAHAASTRIQGRVR